MKICSNVIRSIKKKRTKLCGVLWDSTTVSLSAVFAISDMVSRLYLNGAVCLGMEWDLVFSGDSQIRVFLTDFQVFSEV